ncbi:MFS transporter [Actinokineospora spheciospongiae]|uniref:MFS transporter n=1 Tax=Actinokineospora spheciospongiae TaxID=909613 RepID=UPI000D719495|nr:MFS transporter [Actinokineospora spheciospongiae]PWW58253.1 putative MFS family arabinose efflux permease [Actinokineospora spheciospongiae]
MLPARFRALPLPLRVLFIASFVNRAGMFVFPLLAVYLVQGKGLSQAAAGVLLSLGSTGLLVGSLLSGPLSAALGCRAVLLSALVLNAAGYLGLAAVGGPPTAYGVLLFVALVGMGMFAPAANTLIAELAPADQRPFAYTVNYVANNLGMGVGPLLGGLAAAYSHTLMFLGNIAVGLVCAVMIRVWVPAGARTGRVPREEHPRRSWAVPAGQGHVLAIVLMSFCYVVPLIGIEYVLPLGVTTVLHESPAVIGLVYTINSVIVVGAGFAIERQLKKYPTKTLLLASGGLWVCGIALFTFLFSLPAILLSTLVWTLGEIIVAVVVPTYIADHAHPDRVSGFMAVNGFVLGLARLVVPMGLGLAWQAGGHQAALYALLLVPITGMVLFGLVRTRRVAPTAGVTAQPDQQPA